MLIAKVPTVNFFKEYSNPFTRGATPLQKDQLAKFRL